MLYLSINQASVRAGDSVKLTLSFSGNNRLGILAQLRYDETLCTVEYCRPIEASGWTTEKSGNRMILYDSTQDHPIGTQTDLCEISFRISEDAAGQDFSVSIVNATASDGVADVKLADVSVSAPVLPPYSQDASLASLTVSGYELSPEFSPTVKSYTLSTTVSYADRDLIIEAIPNDSGAAVSVSGSRLKLGKNNIRILVTAENGTQRVYTISAFLTADNQNDDNGENRLSSLSPSVGILSPSFEMDVTQYVLYLPYEIRSVTLTGIPYDSHAKSEPVTVILKGNGVTTAAVVCCAENGDILRYWVEVVVLPQYFGVLPEIKPAEESETETGTESSPETDPETEPMTSFDTDDHSGTVTQQPQTEESTVRQDERNENRASLFLWLLLILLAAGGGFTAGYLIRSARAKKSDSD